MVLKIRFMGKNCDAGTGGKTEIIFKRQGEETFEDRIKRILDEVESSGKDPSEWVIVIGGSDEATFYLKHCKDENNKKMRFTHRARRGRHRVFYIVDAMEDPIWEPWFGSV